MPPVADVASHQERKRRLHGDEPRRRAPGFVSVHWSDQGAKGGARIVFVEAVVQPQLGGPQHLRHIPCGNRAAHVGGQFGLPVFEVAKQGFQRLLSTPVANVDAHHESIPEQAPNLN